MAETCMRCKKDMPTTSFAECSVCRIRNCSECQKSWIKFQGGKGVLYHQINVKGLQSKIQVEEIHQFDGGDCANKYLMDQFLRNTDDRVAAVARWDTGYPENIEKDGYYRWASENGLELVQKLHADVKERGDEILQERIQILMESEEEEDLKAAFSIYGELGMREEAMQAYRKFNLRTAARLEEEFRFAEAIEIYTNMEEWELAAAAERSRETGVHAPTMEGVVRGPCPHCGHMVTLPVN